MRYFIMYLCDENRLNELTNFPYHDCLYEVYMILMAKARSCSFYDNTFQNSEAEPTNNLDLPSGNNNNQLDNKTTAIKFYEIAVSLLIKKEQFYEASKVYVEIYKRILNETMPNWMSIENYLDTLENNLLPAIMMLSCCSKISQKNFVIYEKINYNRGYWIWVLGKSFFWLGFDI